jgi:hypothetical protein
LVEDEQEVKPKLCACMQKLTQFNPVVYLVSGFRWSLYDNADVSVGISLAMILVFLAAASAPSGGSSRGASVCASEAAWRPRIRSPPRRSGFVRTFV